MMVAKLVKDLEDAWMGLSDEQRDRARKMAREVLGNLAHYRMPRLRDDSALDAAMVGSAMAAWAKEETKGWLH